MGLRRNLKSSLARESISSYEKASDFRADPNKVEIKHRLNEKPNDT